MFLKVMASRLFCPYTGNGSRGNFTDQLHLKHEQGDRFSLGRSPLVHTLKGKRRLVSSLPVYRSP
jgi:hypothetical protein